MGRSPSDNGDGEDDDALTWPPHLEWRGIVAMLRCNNEATESQFGAEEIANVLPIGGQRARDVERLHSALS